mgnify:CR=1 FL=1
MFWKGTISGWECPVRNWTNTPVSEIPCRTEEEEAKWEQRRYEIAKEVFIHHRLVANSAVYEADD